MNRLACIIGLLLLLFAAGCTDEALQAPDLSELEATPAVDAYAALEVEMETLEAEMEGILSAPAKQSNVVELPAGSNDALADAIDEAGPGGTVLLRSGVHTESGTVEVRHRVNVVGESGAVLEVNTGSWPDQRAYVEPALYVRNTSRVVIWRVDIRPPAAQVGGAAILVENAPQTIIGKTGLYDHQFGIIIQKGDHARVWKNTIVTTPPSPTLGAFTPVGIVNAVGGQVQIAQNNVSNANNRNFCERQQGPPVEE